MPSRTIPWVTTGIILLNVAVFVWSLTLETSTVDSSPELRRDIVEQTREASCYGFFAVPSESDRFVCTYGFQPAEFLDTVGGSTSSGGQSVPIVVATLFTAVFIHAGWMHLIGNMLFLWVFGDNVEDRLGHMVFLLFYLLGGAAASLAQTIADPNSVVPTVGASGAVAAVLGAYLWYFPRATVTVALLFFIFIPIPVPAVLLIGFWFVQNLLAGIATINNAAGADAGIAWFAHIGGFAFGFLVALAGLAHRRRPPSYS